MPLHSQLQSPHQDHSLNAQSTVSTSHSYKSSHFFTSSRFPSSGFPHPFGRCRISRLRIWNPVPQVAVQVLHSAHWSHAPSMQCVSHDCRLQGATSSLVCGSHNFPPYRGAWTISRSRTFCPPPQEAEQAPYSVHSPQTQSMGSTQGSTLQLSTSFRLALQPSPPPLAEDSTSRVRYFWPPPQVTLHAVQLLQYDSAQSCFISHCCVLQAAVCFISSLSHGFPSFFSGVLMALVRIFCPPPHSAEQSDQAVHSAILQSTGW
mmetsp:Transcript_3655/g.8745  ORF Transcript_3655/g.8745 Transcript_3655/m.8745 type:complete len:261 (-) Transcript_3655:5519-6301(-)